MSDYYFDTSALVKNYLTEPGTTWVRELIARTNAEGFPFHTIYASVLTWVEVPAAIAVVRRIGRVGEHARLKAFEDFLKSAAARYQLLPISESLLVQAAYLTQKHPLKAYDAVHLSAAIFLNTRLAARGEPLIFVSGDAHLLNSAKAEGLATDNPFNHIDLDGASPLNR